MTQHDARLRSHMLIYDSKSECGNLTLHVKILLIIQLKLLNSDLQNEPATTSDSSYKIAGAWVWNRSSDLRKGLSRRWKSGVCTVLFMDCFNGYELLYSTKTKNISPYLSPFEAKTTFHISHLNRILLWLLPKLWCDILFSWISIIAHFLLFPPSPVPLFLATTERFFIILHSFQHIVFFTTMFFTSPLTTTIHL